MATSSTLHIDGRLVMTAESCVPDAEYALFDPGEVILRAIGIGEIREVGYQTRGSLALARLGQLGITHQVAEACAELVRPTAAIAYARGEDIRRVIHLVGAAELFDGFRYNRELRTYEGFYLDLATLARDLGIPNAGLAIQAIGLFERIRQLAPETEVFLDTGTVMAHRRPGERSFKKFNLAGAIGDLPGSLRQLATRGLSSQLRIPERRSSLIMQSLERFPMPPRLREELEFALVVDDIPTSPDTLSEPPNRKKSSGTTDLLWDEETPTPRVSLAPIVVVGTSSPSAQAPPANLELTSSSLLPPPPSASAPPVKISSHPALSGIPGAPRFPGFPEDVSSYLPSPPQAISSPPPAKPGAHVSSGSWAKGASLPPLGPPPPARLPALPNAPRRLSMRAAGPVEVAENLSLPPGLHGQVGTNELDLPRSVLDARVQFTHLSRELGKYYRTRHGIVLRTDVTSIEAVQAKLRERFPNGQMASMIDAAEAHQHGAFLSEVLARRLGAEWTDITPSEIGYWEMTVPAATRVWPFGRVLRFIGMGHKERDLVSYYLELEARAHGVGSE